MRAVVMEEIGGPEVLQLAEVPTPQPRAGQVAIDVAYAGIGFAEVKARANGGWGLHRLPYLPGMEVGGRVRALGPGVEGLTVGQPVAAFLNGGGYAEVAIADPATVFPLPEGMSARTGATLPTVMPTAHALIHEIGRLAPGETVLVQSAAGGVGTAAAQLAKAAGAAAVYGVVSRKEKADYALEQGYDKVFVGDGFLREVRQATEGRGVDLVLDPVGGRTFYQGLEALALYGRLVTYGNASFAPPLQVGHAELYPTGSRAVAGYSMMAMAAENPAALRALAAKSFPLVLDGTVNLPVTAEFPLAEAHEAHRIMENRTSTGKILLRVRGE
jgi:NADPH:quinone reductase